MKKFIIKCLFFLLPFFFCMVLMELLLRGIPNDYKYKKEYLDKHSNDIETLILGSSHSFRGLDPTCFSSITFNAGMISQSLNYDFEIFKKYQNRFNNLKTIILPISYFSLFGKLEDGVESWRVKNYIIYYKFNTSHSLSDHLEILSNSLSVNKKRVIAFYVRGNSNISSSELGWGARYKSATSGVLLKTGKTAALRHSKDIKSIKCQKNYKENLKILNTIAKWSRAKNVRLLLFTPPAFETYRKNLNKEQLDITKKVASDIASKYNNCSYYNFLSDDDFVAKDFCNADHLSAIGAKKLSKILNSKILDKQ